MKRVRYRYQGKSYFALKRLVPAIVILQLAACGGGGGGATKSSSEKIPDAYRVSSVSNSSATLQGSSDTNAGKTGNLELSWSAPSTRTDGEPLSLSDIDGYRLYYGKKKDEYIKGADIKDGSAQSAIVTGVPNGKYYVVMTTYDVNGVESGYSQAVRKKVI